MSLVPCLQGRTYTPFKYAQEYSWSEIMWSIRKLSSEAKLDVEKPSVLENIKQFQKSDTPVINKLSKEDREL